MELRLSRYPADLYPFHHSCADQICAGMCNLTLANLKPKASNAMHASRARANVNNRAVTSAALAHRKVPEWRQQTARRGLVLTRAAEQQSAASPAANVDDEV